MKDTGYHIFMECLNNLRTNLKRIRLLQGRTQQDVADTMGVEQKYFQSIESGRWPNLTLSTLQKIADALHVKPWELLCDVPNAGAPAPVRKRGIKAVKRKKH
jgi:transcriptional regulator with XRE-family HTH domain